MSTYLPTQLPPEHANAPLTQKGIIATFHTLSGKTYDVKFEHSDPVRIGSKFEHYGFLMMGMRYVWDGTYTQPYYSNECRLQSWCEGALNRGFFNFKDELVPFMEVTKITKKYYDYKVPLDTYISQGD